MGYLSIRQLKKKLRTTTAHKQWRGLQRVQRLVSQVRSVTWDTEAATKPATAHSRDRCMPA